jgi:hypothetical protein
MVAASEAVVTAKVGSPAAEVWNKKVFSASVSPVIMKLVAVVAFVAPSAGLTRVGGAGSASDTALEPSTPVAQLYAEALLALVARARSWNSPPPTFGMGTEKLVLNLSQPYTGAVTPSAQAMASWLAGTG